MSEPEAKAGNRRRGQDKQTTAHPILIAVFPLLFFFGQNAADLDLTVLIRPVRVVVGAVVLVTHLMARLTGDRKIGGLLVSFWTVTFFSHGYIYYGLRAYGYAFDPDRLTTSELIVVRPYAALVFGVSYFLFTRKDLFRWTYLMNVWALILVLLPLLTVGRQTSNKPAGVTGAGYS